MIRQAWTLVLMGVLASVSWGQDVKSPQDTKKFLEQLQIKLEHTARRANQPNASGSNVIGLRGTKQEPMSKQLYWKGKTGPTPVSTDEVKAFRMAIDQAQAGHAPEAIAALKAFQEKFPKSSLSEEAKETLELLQASSPAPSAAPIISSREYAS